jgi:hypothetical protein
MAFKKDGKLYHHRILREDASIGTTSHIVLFRISTSSVPICILALVLALILSLVCDSYISIQHIESQQITIYDLQAKHFLIQPLRLSASFRSIHSTRTRTMKHWPFFATLVQRSCQVSNHKDSATLLTRHTIVCFVGGLDTKSWDWWYMVLRRKECAKLSCCFDNVYVGRKCACDGYAPVHYSASLQSK